MASKSSVKTADVRAFISLLAECSERAARIARSIRSLRKLVSLLVEEKKSKNSNSKFKQDFKTIADVLIQEVVRYYIGKKYPKLKEYIMGEESSEIKNSAGKTVSLQLKDNPKYIEDGLTQVLNGNREVASILCELAHKSEVVVDEEAIELQQLDGLTTDISDLGIWIDPVDGTAMYKAGGYGMPDGNGILSKGLNCTAIIIGVYSKSTGKPVAGVQSCPFPSTESTVSDISWGYCGLNGELAHYCVHYTPTAKERVLAVISSADKDQLVPLFPHVDFVTASGAGYKMKTVYESTVDLFVSIKGNTFFWDTCGGNAVVAGQGGGMVDFTKLMKLRGKTRKEFDEIRDDLTILYHKQTPGKHKGAFKYSLASGFVLYRSVSSLLKFAEISD